MFDGAATGGEADADVARLPGVTAERTTVPVPGVEAAGPDVSARTDGPESAGDRGPSAPSAGAGAGAGDVVLVGVPVTEDELVGLSRRIDHLEAVRVAGLVGFFAADGHRAEGFPTKAGWMRARLGLTDPAARSLLVRVSRMAAWSTMCELWLRGELTGAQVEMVVRLIPKALVDLYAEHDAECSPVLVGLSVADTKVVIDEWVSRADAVTSADPSSLEGPPVVPPSEAQWSRTLGDRAEQRGTFSPGDATVIENALRVAERDDQPGEVRTAAQRRAEALVDIARFFSDHHASHGTRPGRQHPHILVTVDLDGLAAGVLWGAGITTRAQLDAWCGLNGYGAATRGFLTHALARGSTAMRTLEGRALTPEVVNDLFGEGTTLARLLLADGHVIDHGRSIRLATPTLRDAILVRDGTCRFPGCTAPAAWADIHHVQAWSDGGCTDIAKLVALCGAHHGMVHRKGHGLDVRPDGTVVFTFPDRPPVHSPPRNPPPRLPLNHPDVDALTPDPWEPPAASGVASPHPGTDATAADTAPTKAGTPAEATAPTTADTRTDATMGDLDADRRAAGPGADVRPAAEIDADAPGQTDEPRSTHPVTGELTVPGELVDVFGLDTTTGTADADAGTVRTGDTTPAGTTTGAVECRAASSADEPSRPATPAVPTEISDILDDLVAFFHAPELTRPHDEDDEPLDDDAIDELIRQRAHRLVRAA